MVLKAWELVGVVLVCAGVVGGTEGGVMVMYKAVGEGLCGDNLGTHVALSVAFCAVWCSQDTKPNSPTTVTKPPTTDLNIISLATPIAAGDMSGVQPVDILNNNGKCNSNFGAVGMIRTDTDGLSLLCKNLGNELSFNQGTPTTKCDTSAAQQKCMTASCGANLYYGFELSNNEPHGPCGVFQSSKTQVNTNNCHKVMTHQEAPSSLTLDSSTWKEWKACGSGGGGTVMAMTGAEVTDTKDITSITCCELTTQ
ncbi:hypothetical protein Pcinc_001652 [Petrolisthes cinctipes]|uniref:Uncharacterized protein n=1 Tax=Petrolisthes cinctipes TaxID=88211 RepID=A0AAE1GMX7_PETCI|nr:hypothetical protein Pcinc_001652 [Petrolisthes cinctipes]